MKTSGPQILYRAPCLPWRCRLPKWKFLDKLARSAVLAAGLMLAAGTLSTRAQSPVVDDGAEVLTRGPVHEAFAETVTFQPGEGILVPRVSPALIEELPPDQRPEGENISWIPGYWAWDDEGSDFIWVSGIWRNLPPGRQWMPGYWSESGAGFQWVSGYWSDAAEEEVEYLSEPPASIEAGPNSISPSSNHTWMPGTWLWRESRYQWQPGTWNPAQADWVWMPSYYVRTPRGYVYVDGYWDYSVARRGMIFAPVRFSGNYYSRPDYVYRPDTVISLVSLVEHLFLRPRQRHYYFGDYYAPEYRRSGYYASYTYASGEHGYDPIYAYNRWTNRGDNQWDKRNEENFRFYRDNKPERPPHTLAAFRQFNKRSGGDRHVEAEYVTPLSLLAGRKDKTRPLKAVNEEDRRRLTRQGREIRDFGEQRRKLSVHTKEDGVPGRPEKSGKPGVGAPVREKARRSPLAAPITGKRDPNDTPPQRPRAEVETKPVKPRTGPKEEPKRRPQAEPKEEPKRKPRAEPKEEPKRKPQAEPKEEPKRRPQAEPKEEPKRKPRAEPKEEPQRKPRAEPKEEPKRKPRAEPKEEPKRKPQAEPKEEPKRKPRAEPKEEPKPQPRPEPKEEPKTGPKKDGDQEKEKKEKPRGR